MAYNPTKKMDVTGPVQPNDIVMRASEIGQSMPGIGALAYKQARKGAQKGIKGIHMIPDTTNQNMDFMGIAKQNVNSQLTRMANTVEAASAPPGHMLAFITPEEAGVLRLLGGTGEMTAAGIPAFPPEGQYGQGGGGTHGNTGSSTSGNTGGNQNQGGNNPYGGGPMGLHSDYGGTDTSTDTSTSGTDNDGGGTYDNLTDKQIKDRLRNPDRFSPEDVQNAINQAADEGVSTTDAFGNKLGNIGNETTKSLAVRDMMMNAAGYNPNAKGYDNPFNVGMDLDLGYKTYDRMLAKGYTPQQIAKMNFTQTKGLLGDMKFNATLDGETVGSFNMNKPGGFLDSVFGSGGFTFARDYASQGNRGGNRDRNFVNQMIEEEEGGGGSSDGEESNYLDADEYYLPEDYTSFRITEGDRVPGRRRFLLRKDGTKLPEGESYSIEDILDYAMSGGYNLLEPFSEYQSRRREYYGDPDFGQGTEFDYSGSTGGTGD